MIEHKDIITKIFQMPFIDDFHGYQDPLSNIRLYHMLKAARVRKFIEKYQGLQKNILDAGAGRAPYSRLACDLYQRVYCYEFSPLELESARKNLGEHNNIEYGEVDLTNIPLADESVDVIVCSEVLEHILDYNKAAAELFRVLKMGGRALISMPNNNSLFYHKVRKNNAALLSKNSNELSHEEWEFLRHLQFDSGAIDKIAQTAGFRIINRRGVNILPLPTALRKLFINKLPFMLRLFIMINGMIGKLMPRFGSFYFLELKK